MLQDILNYSRGHVGRLHILHRLPLPHGFALIWVSYRRIRYWFHPKALCLEVRTNRGMVQQPGCVKPLLFKGIVPSNRNKKTQNAIAHLMTMAGVFNNPSVQTTHLQ